MNGRKSGGAEAKWRCVGVEAGAVVKVGGYGSEDSIAIEAINI
jgi:hypothetical protein